MSVIYALFHNRPLIIATVAWITAQTIKVIYVLLTSKQLDFGRFVGSGGMPSSHSAFVTSLSTAIGQLYGWDSGQAAIAIAFALVVMYDASGVRRAAGKQAEVLNKMLDEFAHHKHFSEERLKELIGHTPVEVLAGAVLGILLAIILL